MRNFRKIFLLLGVAACMLTLSGCEDLEYVHENSYVLYWRKAAPEVVYKRPENLSTWSASIKILFWGSNPTYTATYDRSRATYDQLCAKWGDTKFKGTRKILSEHPAYEYTSTDMGFTAMDISIDKDVKRNGETYPAGTSLASVAEISFTTLRRYIENGYKRLPDGDYNPITEIDDRMSLYGYETVTKLVSELTPEDLQLVGPYARVTWLSKTSVPLVYNVTITLTDEYGNSHVCKAEVDPYSSNL